MARLSIVIPAYNAERTIARVVASVRDALAKLPSPTEVVVVDDGSADGTGEVLDGLSAGWASPSVRLRVIRQPNGGCYRARLAGLRAADCEYFGFVDSDDFVDPDMYAEMMKVAESGRFDVVACEWRFEGRSERDLRPCEVVEALRTREDVRARYVRPTLVGCGASAYLWNKIYRRQHDFSRWVDGDFGSYEDLILNLQLFVPVTSYARVSNRYYRYAPTDASVTRTFSPKHLRCFAEAAKAKRSLVGAYVAEDEIGDAMRVWIANERRNFVKKAILAARFNVFKLARDLWTIARTRVS